MLNILGSAGQPNPTPSQPEIIVVVSLVITETSARTVGSQLSTQSSQLEESEIDDTNLSMNVLVLFSFTQ